MIQDLDLTLEALLQRELPLLGRDGVAISFAAPDGQFAIKLPAIDVFLYDLRENLELRGNDDLLRYSPDGSSATRYAPPVRIDASYLITAWPGGSPADSASDEHRLLGAVMVALLRHRKLPGDLLKGSLANQRLPVPVAMLQPGRLQSLGEFWQALGGKPKAALNYTVTLTVDAFDPVTAPLVTEKDIRVGPMPKRWVGA